MMLRQNARDIFISSMGFKDQRRGDEIANVRREQESEDCFRADNGTVMGKDL